ncbi:10022_t:CDS:2 [Ambispora gerdemannii]|uniref:10022_t:CDS:1 n=1 Tax=Ambispora gerdemannii TaxID=144530 RepID=A0A9N8YWR6_9GLOM|nr:10022_t:CDS:2 [Ambispora gerdemannii]
MPIIIKDSSDVSKLGRTVKIDKIRSDDENPGLRDFEASFLRLLEKVTNGSVIEISYTGTSVLYKPGVIIGGKISHDCGTARAIGYYLEQMIAIAPFAKSPFNLTLSGITNDNVDVSIMKRGAPPLGGGEINFKCPTIRALKPIGFVDDGRIKRIRGIACSTRVSPQTANRMVNSARAVLNRYIPDIYIYTDVFRGEESGKSPGFALSLVSETTTGVLFSAERAANPGETPEDIGNRTAKQLLSEIRNGGCVDSISQWLVLLLMVLCSEDVSKVRVGKLSAFTIQYVRDIKEFFGVTFKIKQETYIQEQESSNPSHNYNDTLLLSCVGIGYVNYNKKTT